MDLLFYDGQCPLCAREIATLRKLERGGLSFVDIHQQRDNHPWMPDKEQLLRRLHLMTADGELVTGLAANVRAWSHTGWGWVFKPLVWPGIHSVASVVYERWADRRYEKRYQCGVACGVTEAPKP